MLSITPPRRPAPARPASPARRPTGQRRAARSAYLAPIALANRGAQLPVPAVRAGEPPQTSAVLERTAAQPPVRARYADTADRVVPAQMPRQMTIGRLAAALQLGTDELAWLPGALCVRSARTKLRKLDRAQTITLARPICELD